MNDKPKGISNAAEEERLRINSARFRRGLLTTAQRDRLALAEDFRKEHDLKPPSPEVLQAAGVKLPPPRPPRKEGDGPEQRRWVRRGQRGSIGSTLLILLVLVVFLYLVFLWFTNGLINFFQHPFGLVAFWRHLWNVPV